MAAFKHNKKKNLLLLWEFFSFHAANAILENKEIDPAKNIVSTYLFSKKNLKKEFEIVKTLQETKGIKSKNVAEKILRRLEEASKSIDLTICESDKNKLLAELARLKDNDFFDRKINPDFYRKAALAHTLVSSWAGRKGISLLEIARLEDYFVSSFIEEEKVADLNENILELQKEDIDELVVHVMHNKFNEIYSKELNDIQKLILKEWIVVQTKDIQEQKMFAEKLSCVRTETKNFIEHERNLAKEKGNESYCTVLEEAIGKIQEANDKKEINDDFIAFHLSLVQLVTELKTASTMKENGEVL